jgi:AAA15 family ATPase/GTPase
MKAVFECFVYFVIEKEITLLTAIYVGNFKAFAEAQRILVRPLTLIYGANSSGKSSVLHSLVLAHHTLETGDGQMRSPYISLSGNVRHGKEYFGIIIRQRADKVTFLTD